jgi:glycosyltransferase involved in cell wall biosynthesis
MGDRGLEGRDRPRVTLKRDRLVLGVDASRAAGQPLGVGYVLRGLLHAWSRQPLPFDQVRVFSGAPIEGLPDDERFVAEVAPMRGPPLWWQATRLRARANDVDVLYAPYTLPPGFRGLGLVHQLGILEGHYAIPGWRARARSRHMSRSAQRADLVIVNGPTTKADLVSCYGVDPSKIRMVPAGRDPRFRPRRLEDDDRIGQAVTTVLGSDAPYILFVGKLSQRRHVPELLEAFAMAVPAGDDLRLLLSGPDNTGSEIVRLAAELGVADTVHHTPYLSQDVLRLLYRGAKAFVMLSEKESTPRTLLEALASGCPTVTLRCASLGMFDYLDGPRDHAAGGPVLEAADATPAGLAAPLDRLIEDDELCAELGRRAHRFAATFPTFDQAAAEIMNGLAEVAGEPSPHREDAVAARGLQ